MSSLTWYRQASLDAARYRHSCGVIRFGDGDKMVVVAAGGIHLGYTILKKVELLVVNETTHFADYWVLGPNSPFPIVDAASATTSDQTGLFLIGGTADNINLNTVLRFWCLVDDIYGCVWTKVYHELKRPGAQGLALVMKASSPMAIPESANIKDCTNGKKYLLNRIHQCFQLFPIKCFTFY